jgi:hypothetical protein
MYLYTPDQLTSYFKPYPVSYFMRVFLKHKSRHNVRETLAEFGIRHADYVLKRPGETSENF